MSYTKENQNNLDSKEDLIDFSASVQFFANPKKIIDLLGCNIDDTSLINKYAVFFSGLSNNEKATLMKLLALSVYTVHPKLKAVYDAIKLQSENDHVIYRSDISTVNDILAAIKDNWQSIAIIALFIRSLGKTKLVYEGESVFESITKLLDKFKDQ